jgi:hypothetical protein
MSTSEQYPYIEARNNQGQSLLRPLLPLTLQNNSRSTTVQALLDSGATVNVLSFNAGIELGLSWDEHARPITLAGNLAQYESRAVILTGRVGHFSPIPLIFAWTQAENIPLILGQVNFFAEFDVCFFASRKIFDISPKSV